MRASSGAGPWRLHPAAPAAPCPTLRAPPASWAKRAPPLPRSVTSRPIFWRWRAPAEGLTSLAPSWRLAHRRPWRTLLGSRNPPSCIAIWRLGQGQTCAPQRLSPVLRGERVPGKPPTRPRHLGPARRALTKPATAASAESGWEWIRRTRVSARATPQTSRDSHAGDVRDLRPSGCRKGALRNCCLPPPSVG